MTVDAGGTRDGSRIGSAGGRPGSRGARLAEAEKQLAIVLEELDLDAEPAVGGAVVEAVRAVGRARSRARPDESSEDAAPYEMTLAGGEPAAGAGAGGERPEVDPVGQV